jgi:hypothetical protein
MLIQCLKDIYFSRSNVVNSKVHHALSQQAPNSLTPRDKALPCKSSRVISQAFAETTLRSFEFEVIEKIQQLSAALLELSDDRRWSYLNFKDGVLRKT